MRVLEQREIESIIARGKNAPEFEITAILDELEKVHPGVYRMIYGEPSDVIASINKDMSNLYLDISFDVIWVFRKGFGRPPEVVNDEKWTAERLTLIDAELKSLVKEIPMSDKFRRSLQERFVKSSFESKIQLELLKYIDGQVEHYASFDEARAAASQITNNLLFVLVRLVGDLYNLAERKLS
jgi:hypothetical protein